MAQCDNIVTLARATVNCRFCHVCAFFNSREEEFTVLLPFLKEGFDAGDRAVHILDKKHRAERVRRLMLDGIDAVGAKKSGRLEMRTWDDAHLRGARFDQNRMIELLRQIGSTGSNHGTGIARIWANMEWTLLDFPGVHDILEYESRINDVLPNYDLATVCTCDLRRFSASLVMDVLRTHPLVILGGILQDNPFYVPPVEFLRELRSRSG